MSNQDQPQHIFGVRGNKVVVIGELKGDVKITNQIAMSTAIDLLDIVRQESGEAKQAFILKFLEDSQYNPSFNPKKREEAARLYEEFESLTPKQIEDLYSPSEKYNKLRLKLGWLMIGLGTGTILTHLGRKVVPTFQEGVLSVEPADIEEESIEETTSQRRRYTKNNGWISVEGDKVVVGITDFVQSLVSKIPIEFSVDRIELPEIASQLVQFDKFATVEAGLAKSVMYAPVSGKVLRINEGLHANPGLLNEEPYGRGWIVEVRLKDIHELDNLPAWNGMRTNFIPVYSG